MADKQPFEDLSASPADAPKGQVAASSPPQAAARSPAAVGMSYGWVVLAAGFFAMVIAYGSATYGFGVFFKPLLAEFGWSRGVTSMAFLVYMLSYGTSSIFMGMLTDRYGPRLTTALGGFIMGASLLLLSLVSALWQLYLFYGLMGVSMGAFFGPLSTTIARWFEHRRGLALGILMAGTGTGGIVPFVAQWVISTYGWRTAYVWHGIAALAIILMASLLMRQPASASGSTARSKARGQWSLRQALGTRPFWTLMAMYWLWGIVYGTVLVHLVAYATDEGMSAVAAASLITVVGLSSVAGRLLGGGLSDKIGTKRSFLICFGSMVLSLVWVMYARGPWMFYVFAGVFGLFYGGHTPLWAGTVSRYYGLQSMGAIFGALLFGATSGAAVGSPLGGFIFDLTKSYYAALLVGTIGIVVLLVLLATLGPPKKREG